MLKIEKHFEAAMLLCGPFENMVDGSVYLNCMEQNGNLDGGNSTFEGENGR